MQKIFQTITSNRKIKQQAGEQKTKEKKHKKLIVNRLITAYKTQENNKNIQKLINIKRNSS